jgi:nicotinamide mononucleotide transporter
MSPLETIAFLLGIANIVLLVRRSLWNYPFGIAMVALYALIFFRAKLYSDAGLQIFFLIVQAYGWWYWARSKGEEGAIRVERLAPRAALLIALGAGAAILLWGWVMHRHTDAAYPWWDGSVAVLSVIAQILLARRYLENWALWVLVDVLAIGLYAAKDLWLTSALYVIFLALSVAGHVEWRRARRDAIGRANS